MTLEEELDSELRLENIDRPVSSCSRVSIKCCHVPVQQMYRKQGADGHGTIRPCVHIIIRIIQLHTLIISLKILRCIF